MFSTYASEVNISNLASVWRESLALAADRLNDRGYLVDMLTGEGLLSRS